MTRLYETQYCRQDLKTGIVHIGYGAFHRAHQSVFIDDYMEATGDLRWGIAAVNLRASEATSFAGAKPGYLLRTTAPDGTVAWRRVRPHVEFYDWSQEAAPALALFESADVHTVSITVTESGYCLAPDWSLNADDPKMASELGGGPRNSVYAFLADALTARIRAGQGALNILCCDNIRGNGDVLHNALMRYFELTNRTNLIEWCAENCSFPNSMVDRITPKAPDDLARARDLAFPSEKADAIHSEAFIQWVIQDKFSAPFPDLTQAGAQIVPDVDPYEETKIRILNGGHSGLAYFGVLAGHETFDAAMADLSIRKDFEAWEREDVLEGLTLDLPFDKLAYFEQVAARFENAAIADQLARICMDGWFKMPIYVRPTLRARLAQREVPVAGLDVVASWYVFARRFSKGQLAIDYIEPYWAALEPMLAEGAEKVFASCESLWSDLPTRYPQFVPGLLAAIARVEERFPERVPHPELKPAV